MSLFEGKGAPDTGELRRFGAAWLPAFLLLAGALLWRRSAPPWVAATAWAAAAASVAAALLSPRALRPVYGALLFVTRPVGWALSWVILAAIYFLVVTPVGLALRAFGRDPLARRADPAAASYWMPRKGTGGPERWFRQF
jgi:hypothetical protein